MGFFLNHEICSVKTIKKRAKDSPSSDRGGETVSWWRFTLVHTVSVFEKPSSAPDVPNETFREQATQGGECIPFGSPKICFTSMPLTTTNNPFTEPKCPLFCTSCCLTNHMEKSCTSLPIPSRKDGVKQGIENLKKKNAGCLINLCSSAFLHLCPPRSCSAVCTGVLWPRLGILQRQWHLHGQEGPCEL